MAGETSMTIVGNVTGDPELRYTQSGAAVASFTVASTPRRFDKASGEWKDGDTLFMRCNVWRQPAENLVESVKRGDRVLVLGSVRQRSFEVEGQKRTVVELDVEEVGPSVRFHPARTLRPERDSQQQRQQQPQGGQPPADDPWGSAPSAANDGRSATRASGNGGGWASEPPF